MDESRMKHGAFGWFELMTTDPEGAKKFYTELFGWETEDYPMEKMNYTVLKVGGRRRRNGQARRRARRQDRPSSGGHPRGGTLLSDPGPAGRLHPGHELRAEVGDLATRGRGDKATGRGRTESLSPRRSRSTRRARRGSPSGRIGDPPRRPSQVFFVLSVGFVVQSCRIVGGLRLGEGGHAEKSDRSGTAGCGRAHRLDVRRQWGSRLLRVAGHNTRLTLP